MSENNEDLSGVMRRVQKLLAIAQDDRANPQEAAAAASMAEKIMRKYQIDNADLISKELNAGHGMAERVTQANMKRDDPKRPPLQKNPPWAGWLAYRVAKLNGCETRYGWSHDKGALVVFCGYDSDVEVAKYMFDYLVGALINAMRVYQKGMSRAKAQSNSYRLGFILAMCASVQRLAAEKEAEMQQAVSSRALVVSKASAIEAHYGAAHYGKPKASTIVVGSAFAEGRAAGAKVDVGRRGIVSTAGTTRRLT